MPRHFPFVAIVGQSEPRLALTLLAIDPMIGGVLITGPLGTAKSTCARSFVDLVPGIAVRDVTAGTTVDRLIRSMDLEAALASGRRRDHVGLLTEAQALCADDVNLFDDAVTAALIGRPEDLPLIATMAVGADTVHPQLLDRFGLCAVTVPCRNPKDRELIVNHRLTFDDGPDSFITTCTDATNEAVNRICAARNKLPDLEWTDAARNKFTELLTQAHAPGQRADLVLARSATAYAAWRGDNNVVVEDVTAVAELVLRHRRRNLSSSQAPSPDLNDAHSHSGPSSLHDGNEQLDEKGHDDSTAASPRVIAPEETFNVLTSTPAAYDRTQRRARGRRMVTRSADLRGHVISSQPTTQPVDLSLPATLRAAAPHQRARRASGEGRDGLSVVVKRSDWRRKVRESRTSTLVVFIVDASGSMGARGRMAASKAAVIGLLQDAYVKRDRVAVITFSGNNARVIVPATSSIERAQRLLTTMAVGGQTPLASGLSCAGRLIETELRRDSTLRPVAIVVTDGGGNVGLDGRVDRTATNQAFDVAQTLSDDTRTSWIIVDTSVNRVHQRDCEALSGILHAPRMTIDDLQSGVFIPFIRSTSRALSYSQRD